MHDLMMNTRKRAGWGLLADAGYTIAPAVPRREEAASAARTERGFRRARYHMIVKAEPNLFLTDKVGTPILQRHNLLITRPLFASYVASLLP